MLQFLHLNALYPLAFVSLKEVFRVFVFWSRGSPNLVMTTKREGSLEKNKHAQKMEAAQDLEIIHSDCFVGKGIPT